MLARLFFMNLHTVALISTTCGTTGEDNRGEVLDTLKYAWDEVQTKLLPHYFLRKKGPREQWDRMKNETMTTMGS
jgi:hypothetical protein